MSMSDTPPSLDRVMLMPIVMQALIDDGAAPIGDPDDVGTARLVCEREGVVAGLPVAKEVFGRFGARLRPLVEEGEEVVPGCDVAELGGPLAAIRGAASTAITFLERCSAIASGALDARPGDPLDAYAEEIRLSRQRAVGDDGPSFQLVIDQGDPAVVTD
jgi:Quinolinate phosphoribosyl transferase, N-terminal domain